MSLGVIFSVAVLEALPRLLPGIMPKKVQAVQRIYDARNSWEGMMRSNRDVGFALRPGLDIDFPSEAGQIGVRTLDSGVDGIGYRDIGTQPPFDAIALGDSFTFCDDSPVESCWVRLLSERTGLSFMDLGVNGYSNLAEARMLGKIAPKVRPKLVLVGFFPNDFKDNVHFYNWTRSGTDDYWTWMRRKRRSDVSEWLARNSVLYRLVDAARRYGKRTTFEYKDDALDFVFRSDDWWRGVVDRAEIAPTYELTQQALTELAEAAKRDGSKLVVLLFPFKEQVYWDVARRYVDEDLKGLDVDAPLKTIGAYLTDKSIAYCDLTGDLRAHAQKGEQLYLRTSAHWTAAGNRVAAQSVADCLAAKGLVSFGS